MNEWNTETKIEEEYMFGWKEDGKEETKEVKSDGDVFKLQAWNLHLLTLQRVLFGSAEPQNNEERKFRRLWLKLVPASLRVPLSKFMTWHHFTLAVKSRQLFHWPENPSSHLVFIELTWVFKDISSGSSVSDIFTHWWARILPNTLWNDQPW